MRSPRLAAAVLTLVSSIPVAAGADQRGVPPRRAAEIAIEDLQPLPAPPYPDPRLPSIDAARRLEDKCDVILQWVDRINVEYTPPSPRGWATVSISRGFQLYRDEAFSQVFGRRFTETTPEWRKETWENVLAKCLDLRKPSRVVGFSGQPSPEDVAQRLMAFRGALEGPFAGRGDQSTAETMRIQHQLRDQRRVLETDLSTLPNAPTLAAFHRLAEYAVNLTKELNALWPSERAYFEKAVMTRRVEVASKALAAWVAAPAGTTIADAVRIERELADYAPLLEVVSAAERDAAARRQAERIAAIVAPIVDAHVARLRSLPLSIEGLTHMPAWRTALSSQLGTLANGPAYEAALAEYRSTRESRLKLLLPRWRDLLAEARTEAIQLWGGTLEQIFPGDDRRSAQYVEYRAAFDAYLERRGEAEEAQRDERCGNLVFDLTAGAMAGMTPDAPMRALKGRFPCFTHEEPEHSGSNLDAGLFFGRHAMAFYTVRKYIEVRTGFAGRLSIPLLGKTPREVRERLGRPVLARPNYDGHEMMFFERPYGCLATTAYGAAGIEAVQVSVRDCYQLVDDLAGRPPPRR